MRIIQNTIILCGQSEDSSECSSRLCIRMWLTVALQMANMVLQIMYVKYDWF